MRFPATNLIAPSRGNFFSKHFARLNYRLIGWRIEGEVPSVPKAVFIGAPHKLLWDVWLCWLVWTSLGVDMRFIFNRKYERGLVKPLARWAGGIPVDTTTRGNVVTQMAQQFEQHKKLFIAIMPEGSRFSELQPVAKWKTGFYHIALQAQVPVVPIYFDRDAKRVIIGEPIELTGNQEHDFDRIQQYYLDPKGSTA